MVGLFVPPQAVGRLRSPGRRILRAVLPLLIVCVLLQILLQAPVIQEPRFHVQNLIIQLRGVGAVWNMPLLPLQTPQQKGGILGPFVGITAVRFPCEIFNGQRQFVMIDVKDIVSSVVGIHRRPLKPVIPEDSQGDHRHEAADEHQGPHHIHRQGQPHVQVLRGSRPPEPLLGPPHQRDQRPGRAETRAHRAVYFRNPRPNAGVPGTPDTFPLNRLDRRRRVRRLAALHVGRLLTPEAPPDQRTGVTHTPQRHELERNFGISGIRAAEPGNRFKLIDKNHCITIEHPSFGLRQTRLGLDQNAFPMSQQRFVRQTGLENQFETVHLQFEQTVCKKSLLNSDSRPGGIEKAVGIPPEPFQTLERLRQIALLERKSHPEKFHIKHSRVKTLDERTGIVVIQCVND